MYSEVEVTSHEREKKWIEHYHELIGEKQAVSGKPWNTEWLLSEYVRCTDGLIGKMDGTIALKQKEIYLPAPHGLKEERRDVPPPSDVIYLDKSARPVSWMIRDLWPVLARRPGTPFEANAIPNRPNEHFLNIDKGDWLRRMGISEHEIEDAPIEKVTFDHVDPELLRSYLTRIRALYSVDPIEEREFLQDPQLVWERPTILDGKHAMIIDEVKSSGRSLRIAQMLLSMAIPEAVFSGEYWAKPARVLLNKGIPDSEGKLAYKAAWVPVWYHKDSPSGRGVSDRDINWPERAEEHKYPVTRVSQIGRDLLSTPFHDPDSFEYITDPESEAIRSDIKQLARDLEQHNILYRPDPARKDAKERIFTINGLKENQFEEWKAKRATLEPKE